MGKTVFVLPKNQFGIFLFLKFSCNPTVNGLGCFYVNELLDLEKSVLFFFKVKIQSIVKNIFRRTSKFSFFLFLSNPTTLKTGLISQNQTVFFRTTEFLVLKCVITVGVCGVGHFIALHFQIADMFIKCSHVSNLPLAAQ